MPEQGKQNNGLCYRRLIYMFERRETETKYIMFLSFYSETMKTVST